MTDRTKPASKTSTASPILSYNFASHIFLITTLYIAAAWAGRMLMPSAYTSPLWPAAGLALAVMLMCGKRCWPGIWLGAFLVDLFLDHSLNGIMVASLLATGSTVQALVGAYITHRLITSSEPLSREGDVWRFLILGGPLACTISATVALLVLSEFDRMTAGDLQTQWLLWWTGDTLGVLLFTPLTLFLWPGNKTLWKQNRKRVALPLIVTAGLLAIGYMSFVRLEENRVREESNHLMEDVYDSAFLSLSSIIEPLRSVERFFAASDTITRSEYAAFNLAIINKPGILSVDWAPRVPNSKRTEFETQQRNEKIRNYKIFELNTNRQPQPASIRNDYYPIAYIAPLEGNTALLGLDHGFEIERRKAMSSARDSGEIVTAKVIDLIRTNKKSILAFNPIYRQNFNAKTASVEARREALRGFIVGVFDIESLFASISRDTLSHQIKFRVTDVTPDAPPYVLTGTLPAGITATWQREFIFSDRHWLLEMESFNHHWQPGANLYSRLYFGFSMVAAFLISFATLSAAGRQTATAAEVVARTADLEHELNARQIAEAALRESERNLDITLRSIGDAVLATDGEGRITRMNPIAEMLTGWKLADASGRPIKDVFHIINEETRHPAIIPVDNVLRTGEIHGLANHTILISRDGNEYHIADSAAPIRDTSGVSCGVVLVFRDVGKERESERALQASESRYRQFIESSPLGIFVQCNGAFVFMNPKATEILGAKNATQLIGRQVLEFIHPDSRDAVIERIKKLNDDQSVPTLDEIWLRLDGSMFHGSATAVPYLYDGQSAALVMLQDVSARKEAEAQLDRFFTMSLDMLCISSADGYFKRISPAFTRTLGWSIDEMLSRPFIDFVHPDDIEATMHEVERQVELGQPVLQFENRYRHKDGSWRILSWRSTPYKELMFATARDVTWQREAAKQLENAKAEAEQANRAKSAFLATMSHEIRTPMNGVLGMVEVLAQSRLSEHQAELINTIRESAMSLLNIIDDILDFSKIEASRLEIEYQPVSIIDLVEGLCNSLVPVATVKGVQMSLFISPEIPERLLSDDVRLRQILYNLIGNAIKFSSGQPDKVGHVSIRVEKMNTSPLHLVFKIQDNGIGMKPETLQCLFTPFTQAEVSTTRRFGGTGLGLAICKRLAELMQGKIHVDSTYGKGSAFTVNLPFDVADEQPVRKQPDLSGLDCILVNNANLNISDLKTYLEFAGAKVITFEDSITALQTAIHQTGPVVLIQYADRQNPGPHLTFKSPSNVHYLLITQGRRRRARVESQDVVTLDGDALRRQALLRAVAIAAGRASPEIFHDHHEQDLLQDDAISPPTIAEARAQGRLILIAEDDELNQRVILQQLRLLGYAGEVANNGEEALQLLREGNYGLLLTDLHMPVMDGYTLAQVIRREERNQRRLPILALTANALRGEANRAQAAGMDEYLTKPIPLRQLRTALEKWLPHPDKNIQPPEFTDAREIDNKSILVDISILKNLIGDNQEIIREFLVDYLTSAQKLANELNTAYVAGDIRHVSAIAHKLKSSSRSVGALALGDICAGLENAGKAGDKASIAQEIQ